MRHAQPEWTVSQSWSLNFGAVPVTVRMQPAGDGEAGGGFMLDLEALRAAFVKGAGRTKVYIHNSPHNPTGAVFTR